MTYRQSYVLVESTYFLRERPRTCFGIALIEEDDDAGSTIIETICDISPDRQYVWHFAELCNRVQPPKKRLMEMLEEFLG